MGKDLSALLFVENEVLFFLQINDIVSLNKIICFNQYLVFSLTKNNIFAGVKSICPALLSSS